MENKNEPPSNIADFYLIPLYIKWHPHLTELDKDVWWMIKCLDNGKAHCYASNAWIADEFDVTEQAIKRSVAKLVKCELVDRLSVRTKKLSIPKDLDKKHQWVLDHHVDQRTTRRQIRAMNKKAKRKS